MVLHHSGLKTGIDFAHFGLESAMVFKGTTRVYKRIVRFNSKWVRKKDKDYIFIRIFCCCSNLSISDDINFLGASSENGCEKWHFWFEIGSGFKEPRGTPSPRILRSTALPRRTVVKTFHELEWCYLIYPRFGKHGKEEYWIFNTQNLAFRKTNRQSFSLDQQLCFLLSCFYKQTSVFMSIALP